MLKKLFLSPVKFYQRYLSLDRGLLKFALFPILGVGFSGKICRHNPSCSQYFLGAVNKYGIIQGVRLGVGRLLTCHPYSA